jgi:PKHD-type hydroxylase
MLSRLDGLLSPAQAAALCDALALAPFVSGEATAAPEAAKIKHNLQLPATHPAAIQAARAIITACSQDAAFQAATLPVASTTPRFCRYDVGMGYGDHHDNPIMGGINRIRSDIAVTISLVGAEAYDGGELVIDSERAAYRWKGSAGDAIAYPASTRHRVDPVQRGSRWVAIFWIQSLVRDPAQRRILFDLWSAADSLARGVAPEQARSIAHARHSLLGMWAEP